MLFTVAVARAVDPIPIGFWIETVGAVVYPTPPSVTVIEITPSLETVAVALAPTWVSISTKVTFFWNSKYGSTLFSFLPSNNGLKLSTYISVDPAEIALVM